MAESRTQKSLRNAKVALFFSALTFALGFFSRKILLEALGSDVIGLYTTAYNLCGFLNLAELGITSAVAFSLYKPLFDDDRGAITEIVSIQGWLFRYVGLFMTIGAVILISLFPIFFNEEKTNLPMWYSYATFGIVFLSQVLGYFFCYQQTLLSADQKEYVITFAFQGGRVLKMALQILGIGIFCLGYEYMLLIELLSGVMTLVIVMWSVKKQYPWLDSDISQGRKLLNNYPIIITKIKQMVVHKICFSIVDKVSPIIVYGLISLSVVTIYGNYMMIITNIGILIGSCFNGVTASIGNLASEGNDKRAEDFFRSCLALRFWLVSICCYCFYHLANPFMELWVGADYLFDNQVLIMLTMYTFVAFSITIDPFICAYGLYQDIWASAIHLVLNIGLSVLLGTIYGVTGIVLGVTISELLVYGFWKPYFLYVKGFKASPIKILPSAIIALGLIVISWSAADYILEMVSLSLGSWGELVCSGIIILGIYGSLCSILFIVTIKNYRELLARIIHIRKKE